MSPSRRLPLTKKQAFAYLATPGWGYDGIPLQEVGSLEPLAPLGLASLPCRGGWEAPSGAARL